MSGAWSAPHPVSFLREARIIARLHHSHIVPIHAVGELDGVLFYVMDQITGTRLDQLRGLPRGRGRPLRRRGVSIGRLHEGGFGAGDATSPAEAGVRRPGPGLGAAPGRGLGWGWIGPAPR